MEQLLKVGIISSTHGIRGQVKIYPTTDDVRRFDDLKTVILKAKGTEQTLHVEAVQYFKQFVIVKFKEYNNINDVEQYKNAELFVTREDAVPLEEDEYFIADLIGLIVETDEGQMLGEVADVIQTGANDVYVVRTAEEKELLLPAIRDCVRSVDMKNGKITIHLMDGLLDL